VGDLSFKPEKVVLHHEVEDQYDAWEAAAE
jgi:hypothetical protein